LSADEHKDMLVLKRLAIISLRSIWTNIELAANGTLSGDEAEETEELVFQNPQ
jgi:hypothetical protein